MQRVKMLKIRRQIVNRINSPNPDVPPGKVGAMSVEIAFPRADQIMPTTDGYSVSCDARKRGGVSVSNDENGNFLSAVFDGQFLPYVVVQTSETREELTARAEMLLGGPVMVVPCSTDGEFIVAHLCQNGLVARLLGSNHADTWPDIKRSLDGWFEPLVPENQKLWPENEPA